MLAFMRAKNVVTLQTLNKFCYQTAVSRVQTRLPLPRYFFFKKKGSNRYEMDCFAIYDPISDKLTYKRVLGVNLAVYSVVQVRSDLYGVSDHCVQKKGFWVVKDVWKCHHLRDAFDCVSLSSPRTGRSME